MSDRASSGSRLSLCVDVAAFRDLLSDQAGREAASAPDGYPLVVVDVTTRAEGELLAGLDPAMLPAVIVVVARDPRVLPLAAAAVADVVLADDEAGVPGAPLVTPDGGVQAGLDAIIAAMAANPVAGSALALLLRSAAGLSAAAGLVAESATYSALQEGAEFRRWRSARSARPSGPTAPRVAAERVGGELRITLARPERRNAVDWRMRDALAEALAAAEHDPGLRVVLRGAGPDFCAGGDLDEFGSRPDPAIAHLVRLTRSPALLLHRLSVRTTAYVHGACLGAGAELPAFAARVVAAPDARFGLPELALGLVPGAGGTVSLPRRIGRWRTAYLALTGECLPAARALRWGLADAVADRDRWP
jgi:enoyl-CoA hydratase/carnithine racemase